MSQPNLEPNINPDMVEYHAASKMWFPKTDSLQCKLCGWVQAKERTTCERCNASNLEPVGPKTRVHFPAISAVAHYSRRVEVCWNELQDAESGQFKGHKLDEGTRLVISIRNEEAHREHYCKTCGVVYTWSEGRAATPQEIQDARNGKLPLRQTNRAMIVQMP